MSTSRLARALLLAGLAAGAGSAFGEIHRCTDPISKAVTISDRPCAETRAPTPADAAASAEAAREEAIAAQARIEAARADRQLLTKYPDPAAHRQAYANALDVAIGHIAHAKTRLGQLVVERRPIDEEAKFYIGKPLPTTLLRQVNASDASFAALADVFRGLEAQIRDLVARYELERDRLRRLWAGAAPGSMGLLGSAPTPPAARS